MSVAVRVWMNREELNENPTCDCYDVVDLIRRTDVRSLGCCKYIESLFYLYGQVSKVALYQKRTNADLGIRIDFDLVEPQAPESLATIMASKVRACDRRHAVKHIPVLVSRIT